MNYKPADEGVRLADMPPGPALCARLAQLEPGALSDDELLDVLQARWRQSAYDQAGVWAAMAEVASRHPFANMPAVPVLTQDQIFDAAVSEVRAELRMTSREARRELEYADAVMSLPAVARALEAGEIDRRRAIVLAQGCVDLTEAQQTKLLEKVLPEAGEVTATGLADKVRRVAIALDPGWAERRYRAAISERRVVAYLNADGSATVAAQGLPADQAAAACRRVDALASAAKRAGAAARTDQLRAEVFLGLLDGQLHGLHEADIVATLVARFAADTARSDAARPDAARPDAARPLPIRGVHIRVGLPTLLGRDDAPAEIAGFGAVVAPVARAVVARQRRAQWRFAIVDEQGQLLHDGITRQRPTGENGVAQAQGGIVELHVPASLLVGSGAADQHPAWSQLLADLGRQYTAQRRPAQDPNARFPGRPLRRYSETNFGRCIGVACRRPASQCDQDHRVEHARGGRTEADNLAPVCSHHNQLKNRGWKLLRTGPRAFTWITPLGRQHVVTMGPIAAPPPEPIPRPTEPLRIDRPEQDEPATTFEPLTQRGRRLAPPPDESARHARRADNDHGPPPF